MSHLKKRVSFTEIPRVQRFAALLPLDRLFPRDGTGTKRNEAIAQAPLHHGYSLQEIAAHVELHYSTMSGIVQRERKKAGSKD